MYVKVCFFKKWSTPPLTHLPVPIFSVFLSSGLSSVLDRWDLPVAVFPFNIIIVLYLLCTGPDNPYFPHHRVTPPGALEPNGTKLIAEEVHGDVDDIELNVWVKIISEPEVAESDAQIMKTKFVHKYRTWLCAPSYRLFHHSNLDIRPRCLDVT